MADRSLLGPADVSDDQLTAMLATHFDVDPGAVSLLESAAEHVDYSLPAITTAGRFWVSGRAVVAGETRDFRVFVKHVQSWSRSPFFAEVPPPFREQAEASVPWRTEHLAYRSDLGDRLPEGLRMLRALGVFELDEKSASIWLEEVPIVAVVWDTDRFTRAARLLGRMAASPEVAAHRNVGEWDRDPLLDYLHGRLATQVLPTIRDHDVWRHPLVAGAYDDELRDRLRDAADHAADHVAELATLPRLTGHGDACPNNLLAGPDDDFVLIDFGFWGELPVGFDLSQLLVGDVQVGRLAAARLPELEEAVVPAYVAGLADEGCDLPGAVVRRAHALQLVIFTGLSTLPVEHLHLEPTPELEHDADERAAIARFSLDLLAATA